MDLGAVRSQVQHPARERERARDPGVVDDDEPVAAPHGLDALDRRGEQCRDVGVGEQAVDEPVEDARARLRADVPGDAVAVLAAGHGRPARGIPVVERGEHLGVVDDEHVLPQRRLTRQLARPPQRSPGRPPGGRGRGAGALSSSWPNTARPYLSELP